MNQIQVQLLDFLSHALFNSDKQAEITTSNALIAEASAQAVLPLIAPNIIPTAKTQVNAILAKNLTVIYEHTEVHKLLTANNIPYVILKGCASYYDDPVFRTIGDVDFLVRPQDISHVGELLESIDFERAAEDDGTGIHIAYHRDVSTWELHRSVNGIPAGMCGDFVKSYLSDIKVYTRDLFQCD